MASFSKDPLGWVLFSFPWGTGELDKFQGPELWQAELLAKIGKGLLTIEQAIQEAISSGHGIGKSALVSWLILWGMSTFPDTKIVVTADTGRQLETKTWPELAKWHRLCICGHWFSHTATAFFSVDKKHERTWRADAITWSENNTEAFAGLHNQGKRIILIFDEASGIADKVWEVSEGSLTDSDTEILWFVFGNPTRATGRFRECFRRLAHRWGHRQIDSRTVSHTNKKQIQDWIYDYGVDSDFVKIRVRGEFPNTSDRQFIPSDLVDKARGKVVQQAEYMFAPKIIGVDPALYGDDECAIYLRQGITVRKLAIYKKLGDDMLLAGYIAKFEDEEEADAVFVDAGGGSGCVSAARQMGRKWTLVNFGEASTKPEYLNKRAEMWGDTRDYLRAGGTIPDDPVLAEQLTAPEYYVTLKGKTVLESKDDMKARGIPSPDRGDAVALTFAFPVRKKERGEYGKPGKLEFGKRDYDPFN